MNGWQGVGLPLGLTNPNNFGVSQVPYMTPSGGTEVMSPIQPLNLQPTGMNVLSLAQPGNNRGWFGISGLGKNLDTLRMGIGVAGGIANVWNGLQQNKLARASFNHQKGILDTNLANQIRSFNLQLDDKLRSRQVVEGTSDADREAARARWAARDERQGA